MMEGTTQSPCIFCLINNIADMLTKEQHNEIDELVALYISGEASREILDELMRRARESDAARRYIREQLELNFSASVAGSCSDVDEIAAYKRFLKRVDRKKRKLRLTWNSRWMMRVAAVILIVLLPMWAYYQGGETVKDTFSDIVVEAPKGSRTKLYLPDGTLVWLNVNSRIVYSQGFGVNDRKLTLQGEGYFEVTHSEELPFEIITREVRLRVVGTKFNFKNYPDDEEVIVNLLEGKVALRNEIKPRPELYMEPDEKVIIDKRTGEMRKTRTDARHVNAWTRDELFFDEELLEDIAKKLMRIYDVKIEIADSLRNRRFYGNFKLMGNNIDEVLQTIASTKRMKYRYENEKYILY